MKPWFAIQLTRGHGLRKSDSVEGTYVPLAGELGVRESVEDDIFVYPRGGMMTNQGKVRDNRNCSRRETSICQKSPKRKSGGSRDP